MPKLTTIAMAARAHCYITGQEQRRLRERSKREENTMSSNPIHDTLAHQAVQLFQKDVRIEAMQQQLQQAQQANQALLGQYKELQALANIGPGHKLYVVFAEPKPEEQKRAATNETQQQPDAKVQDAA